MNFNAFTTCLGYYGVSTGASSSLEGAYALTSGYTAGSTGFYYNQMYSTGVHFVSGQIYAPALPLLNVWQSYLINNNILSGTNGLRVGYQHTGNFSVVMELEYSGCLRPTVQKGMILLSTAATPSGLSSGFIVGITDSNRLYFSTSGYSKTLDRELGVRDFVYVSMSEGKYVNFGIYDLNDNTLYKQSVSLSTGRLNSPDIYLGNFLLSNAADPYTGFYGRLNQVVVFKDTLTDSDVGVCSNCALATGFNTGAAAYSFIANQITGMYFSGVMDWMITGYSNVTGQVTLHDGTVINTVTPSGMTGFVTTGQAAIPMFSGVTISGFRSTTLFQYDTATVNSFAKFWLYFDLMMTSGDTIEVYSYPTPNPNIGKRVVNLAFPTDTGILQMVCNSLYETSGVDYDVVHNQFSGFNIDDILSYDIIPSASIVTAYSGYWSDGSSRQNMTGGAYFPSAPQYLENTGSYSGVIRITGLNGICTGNNNYPNFGYDLYINGQKLLSGVTYNVTTSGTSGFVVWLSGNKLPPVTFWPYYDGTGGATGIQAVDDNELAFIPQFSGFIRAQTDITGTGYIFGPYTGFGEQVWVNGLRGVRDIDYAKTTPCREITGNINAPEMPFLLYDSETVSGQWNAPFPPVITGISQVSQDNYQFNFGLYNPASYTVVGNCFEVWDKELIGAGAYATSFGYNSFIAQNGYATYTGYADPITNTGSGIIMVRYNYRNVIGPWKMSTGFATAYLA